MTLQKTLFENKKDWNEFMSQKRDNSTETHHTGYVIAYKKQNLVAQRQKSSYNGYKKAYNLYEAKYFATPQKAQDYLDLMIEGIWEGVRNKDCEYTTRKVNGFSIETISLRDRQDIESEALDLIKKRGLDFEALGVEASLCYDGISLSYLTESWIIELEKELNDMLWFEGEVKLVETRNHYSLEKVIKEIKEACLWKIPTFEGFEVKLDNYKWGGEWSINFKSTTLKEHNKYRDTYGLYQDQIKLEDTGDRMKDLTKDTILKAWNNKLQKSIDEGVKKIAELQKEIDLHKKLLIKGGN